MKRVLYVLSFLSLLLLFNNVAASNEDSLFLEKVKQYFFRQTGMVLKGEFYVVLDTGYHFPYIFTSSADKIERPAKPKYSVCDFDSIRLTSGYHPMGYENSNTETFFYYKSDQNASTKVTKKFISYPREAKFFIMFHELMHNYINQKKLKMPYDFEEAVCDIMGNYGAMALAKDDSLIDLSLSRQQVSVNEKIYRIINRYMIKVNHQPEKRAIYHSDCYNLLQKQLKKANAFQKDRFDYTVNNGFLLKNKNYSANYFLLKKTFLKAKTLTRFVEIINGLPEDDDSCIKFLGEFLKH
jgi:hypothetical protein